MCLSVVAYVNISCGPPKTRGFNLIAQTTYMSSVCILLCSHYILDICVLILPLHSHAIYYICVCPHAALYTIYMCPHTTATQSVTRVRFSSRPDPRFFSFSFFLFLATQADASISRLSLSEIFFSGSMKALFKALSRLY